MDTPVSCKNADPNPESASRIAPIPLLPDWPDPSIARRRRRVFRLGTAAAVLTLLMVLHRPMLTGFAGLFRVDDPAPSDAIVILIGGLRHRPAHAADLYKQGIAPVILIGTSTLRPNDLYNETKTAVEELERAGVPRPAIVIMPGLVTSTRHEAEKAVGIASSRGWKRITVVTTAYHTSRARWIFRKLLKGQDIDIRMAAAEASEFNESNWYKSDEGLLSYLNELFKIAYYRIRY